MCQLSVNRFSDGPVYSKNIQTWFDVKVFYVRLSASGFNNNVKTPESLTVHYLPRSKPTALDVNGRRIQPSSSAFLTLQRSKADEKSEDIIYVGTDNIRMTGNLCFEVYLRDEILIFGTMEKKEEINEDLRCEPTWTMECSCRLEYSSSKWSFSTTTFSPMSVPALDVYVAGRISGLPIILTQTVQLIPRRKRFRHATLDAIPEGNENAESCSNAMDLDFDSINNLFESTEKSECYCKCGLYDDEYNGEEEEEAAAAEDDDSWFNSGLRVGIGIGLGMCLGVGLLVRTYQGTYRPSRRRIL